MEIMELSELSKGMSFPDYKYTLSDSIVSTYLKAVEETNPLYTDEKFAAEGPFGGRVVPPTTIGLYVTPSRVLRTIGRKPPPGLIHARQRFEFYRPLRVGETVTVSCRVDDMYEKKGRLYVVIRGEAQSESGEKAAVSYITFIWPRK